MNFGDSSLRRLGEVKKRVNKKTSLVIGLFLVFSTVICVNINPVSAHEPIVTNIVPWTSGSDTILNVTVDHGPWGILHWTSSVEIEIDEVVHNIGTEMYEYSPFTLQYNMGSVTGTPTVRARAVCSVTGYGPWCEPVLIPEFSLSHLLVFFLVIPIVILLVKSKITAKAPK